MLSDFFHYGFIQRALLSSILLGTALPLLGMFLVVRRYALFADTVSHVALAGASLGSLFGFPPVPGALILALLASASMEELRRSSRLGGEALLALFLSGSLALAIIAAAFSSAGRGAFLGLLFGSIVTMTWIEVGWVAIGSILVSGIVLLFWRRLFFWALDEDLAQASGLSVRMLGLLLAAMAAILSAIAIPMTGALLLSALMVIPVLSALQLRVSFKRTAVAAVGFSLLCVLAGLLLSYAIGLPSGAAIVMCTVLVFFLTLLARSVFS